MLCLSSDDEDEEEKEEDQPQQLDAQADTEEVLIEEMPDAIDQNPHENDETDSAAISPFQDNESSVLPETETTQSSNLNDVENINECDEIEDEDMAALVIQLQNSFTDKNVVQEVNRRVTDNELAEELNDNSTRPRKQTLIEYQTTDGIRGCAKVLWQQPKVYGAHSNWVNIRGIGAGVDSSVDWDQILWWREKESEQVLILNNIREDDKEVCKAKETEMKNLEDNDVFEWVSDNGQRTVSCRWVITEKEKDDGSKLTKARLVARGFEDVLLSERTDSPTCTKQSLRLVLITAATMSWELKSINVTSAFLQGDKIEREVHVIPPPEAAEEGKVWRLKRCLYGLCDAPRKWYERVVKELQNLTGTVSKFDKALFLWHEREALVGILAVHVDDFVHCGNNGWYSLAMQKLIDSFKISKSECRCFRFIGLNVIQTANAVQVDQNAYAKDLQPVILRPERALKKDAPLNEEEKKSLRSINGQLQWLSTHTRPDIAFDVCVSSNCGKSPTVENILHANKIVKKVQKDDVHICFPALGDPNQWKLIVYGDASHANLPSGALQGAYIIFIVGGNNMCPIIWRSKRLDRVTKSPLASEISAIADAADAGFYSQSIIEEIFKVSPNIQVFTDSDSLKKHLGTTNTIKDLRLRVDTARLREMVDKEEIYLVWVTSKKQLADSLTKYNAAGAYLLKTLMTGVHELDL